MKREHIKVTPRTVMGKQLKKLRREGTLPANVYGKDIKSTAVQLPTSEFMDLYRIVKETGLVDLELEGKTYPVLIYNVAWSSMHHQPLHADFFKVNLKEKITTRVPLVGTGEALAVTDNKGVLMQPVSEVEIEALPTELPEKIEISVEHLAEVDDQITAEQLSLPEGVTLITEPSQVLFKIGELVTEEAEEQAAEEEAAAESASEDAEASVEGETAKEESGEKPADEEKAEKSDEAKE